MKNYFAVLLEFCGTFAEIHKKFVVLTNLMMKVFSFLTSSCFPKRKLNPLLRLSVINQHFTFYYLKMINLDVEQFKETVHSTCQSWD